MLDRNGILHLSGQDTLAPGLREAAFLLSPLGRASASNGSNDGWSRYRVEGTLDNGLNCAAIPLFFTGRLRQIIFCPYWTGSARSWREWSEAGELRVNDQNNELLAEHFGPPPYTFTWGGIESGYDPKSGSSSIVVSYKES